MKNETCLMLFFAILLLQACNAQTENDNYAKNTGIEIFEQTWNIVNEQFYDPNFNGINWDEKHKEYKTKITNCNSIDTLFELINQMLFELNSSHCGVGLITELKNVVSPYIFSSGETGLDIRIIENQIVVTNVLSNSSADLAGIKRGYIIQKINNFTLSDIEKKVKYRPPFNNRNKKIHLTTEVLRLIYGEAGTKVEIDFLDEKNRPVSKTLFRTKRKNGRILYEGMPRAYINCKSHFISDDIAYLSFNAFQLSEIDMILSKLDKLYKSKDLIIDLRGNDGGSIEAMKLFLGRFVSKRQKYGTYINRNERNDDSIEPIENQYTGEVVLLIDEMSISGAENTAGIFQQLNIGKVIGNQTPGQMLWGNGYTINDSIALAVPIYKLEYPNGFNPENNGVKPDIVIKLNREDLLKGKDTQLDKAIEYLNNNL